MEVNSTLFSSLTFAEFTDNVNYLFKSASESLPETRVARKMFNIVPDSGSGTVLEYAEYDGETFANDMAEGVDAAKGRAGLGYSKKVDMERFGKEMEITHIMRTRNKAQAIQSKLMSMLEYIPQREELDLTHRLSFGTSTSFTNMDGRSISVSMGDGFALFYSAHTLAHSSSTYRNRLSGDPIFSSGALVAALNLGTSDILSNFGEKRVMRWTHIWYFDDMNTEYEVMRVLKSTSDVTQNNSGVINPNFGRLLPLRLVYGATTAAGLKDSTKRLWWGIGAFAQGDAGWQAFFTEAEPMSMKAPYQDPHNDNWTFGVRQSRFTGVVSGRGIIGSCPTTA